MPPARVSSKLSIYKGTCLDTGCVLENPDHKYPENIRRTTKVVSWSGEHGELLLKQSHGYEIKVVPATSLFFKKTENTSVKFGFVRPRPLGGTWVTRLGDVVNHGRPNGGGHLPACDGWQLSQAGDRRTHSPQVTHRTQPV